MKKTYKIEREGQIEFFNNYHIPYEDDNSVLIDNTDGIYNGVIFEFKLTINNLNKVLFQAIKYLSKMRIKGESVPATILLVSLNTAEAYVYKSKDYYGDIHKVYVGAASKENEGFIAKKYAEKLDYSDMFQSDKLKKILTSRKTIQEMYIPIDIDENCIVGWAERYYKENPTAKKGDFLGDDIGSAVKIVGEIREPKTFRYLINPYTGKSNEKFKYLMDCLNDRLSKKDLGAFYTPMPYCEKAAELVQMAVERVPEGNDYIILDRCAGTGNLEAALYGKLDKNGNELITHCVVSTYEYYEYKVLLERIGQDVRNIIPPTEANVIYANGKISNADAMSKDYIDNSLIKQYVDNPKCTIILFENPPYRDSSASNTIAGEQSINNEKAKSSYVYQEMKKERYGDAVRDLSNQFIWSGLKFYLRQSTDSYVVFSPVKYYKHTDICNKEFVEGFAFNRSYFHATPSTISCILWSNVHSVKQGHELLVCDIVDDSIKILPTKVNMRKISFSMADYNDKRILPTDEKTNLVCNSDGTENLSWKNPNKKTVYTGLDIIAYLVAITFTPDSKHRYLTRLPYTGGIDKSYGFYLRKDNYLIKLPLWVAKMVPQDEWFERDVYSNSSDGGDAYIHDKDFLKSCLIYTCLSNQNKCLSFNGSDGRYYRNELCFDNTHGNTVASNDIDKMTLDTDEQKLIELWKRILAEAKKTANYDNSLTYGVYQITKELNTFHEEGTGKNKKKVYDYPELNGDLNTLRVMLKDYYKSHITVKMFKYELLK